MSFTLPFSAIGKDALPRVGGKGANLGILTQAGVPVPPGFCVTTEAYERFLGSAVDFSALDALDGSSAAAAKLAAEAMRAKLSSLSMPPEVAREIVAAWQKLGASRPLAVRSSATAEDLPGASFAGQQDTYLNIRGETALLDAVRRCWISLFTDRAVLYRARGHFGHRSVRLSVVVQELVEPEVSGILFTADPISGNRKVASIDAGFGLGEALVSGLISADLYRVDRRTGAILLAQPGDKAFAIRSTASGGTERETLSDARRHARALADDQVRALAEMGARVESIYGTPQDIEWCIRGAQIYVVQARPITSLFPIPAAPDSSPRIYLSFHHFQMMLDPMPRFARELWQGFFPVPNALVEAGSRLYIDATGVLRVEPARRLLLGVLSHLYEALGQSIHALVTRPEFQKIRGSVFDVLRGAARILGPLLVRVPGALLWNDPEHGAAAFQRALSVIPEQSALAIRGGPTPAARIRQCGIELASTFARVRVHLPRLLSGVIAQRILAHWFPDDPDIDALGRGLPGNVTTEMDLAVGDLTDLLRPHPELAALVQERPWPEARAAMQSLPGGPELSKSFDAFLARYGDRGAGEIDASRPRFRDAPALLLRVMAGGLAARPGAHRLRHQALAEEGERAASRLVDKARKPLRPWVRRFTRVARIGSGLREHPKLILVQILAVVRAEALAAGKLLAERQQLAAAADVFQLGIEEIAEALDDEGRRLQQTITARKAALELDRTRTPPIVMSSDGENPTLLAARADLPPGALPGTAASSGVAEGIARVITDPTNETVLAGEILVAPFTDPGWTPLFVNAAAIVTEVGGMMTHGAVVAREYGIPAVVSVANALARIKTGQRIRVDGKRGFVELLARGP
jgi:pyruvate,water dikinase